MSQGENQHLMGLLLMICKAVEMILRAQWSQETCLGVWGGRWGSQGVKEASRGFHGAIGLVWWFMRHICLYTREPNFYCGQASKRVNQRKYKRSSRQPKKGDYEFRALWNHFKVSYVQIIFIFVQYSIIIVISSIFLAKLAKKKCWDPELHNCLIIVHVLVIRFV